MSVTFDQLKQEILTNLDAEVKRAVEARLRRITEEASAMLQEPDSIRDDINEFAPVAWLLMRDFVFESYVTGKNMALALKYASYILAMRGYGPIRNVRQLTSSSNSVTKDEIDAIKNRCDSAKAELEGSNDALQPSLFADAAYPALDDYGKELRSTEVDDGRWDICKEGEEADSIFD